MIGIRVREDRFVREGNCGRKIVCLVGSIIFLTFFAGIYMDSEARETGSAERETSVTFRGTYEDKEEERKGDETERKEEKRKSTAAEQPVVTEGVAASTPKSLPQTGEAGKDAGMGIFIGGMLLAGYLLKKEKQV